MDGSPSHPLRATRKHRGVEDRIKMLTEPQVVRGGGAAVGGGRGGWGGTHFSVRSLMRRGLHSLLGDLRQKVKALIPGEASV